MKGSVLSPSVLTRTITSKKWVSVWEGEKDRGYFIASVLWELQAPILYETAIFHSKGNVFCLQKDWRSIFLQFLFFSGYQLVLAGERGDIKKEMEQNNHIFSGIRSNIYHISTAACWHLSLFPLFICLFLSLLFIYSSLAHWWCRCCSAALGCCVHYCVSIEPFLMNLLRKLKYCRMGRCGSLSLMHGDRWSIGWNNL